MFTNYDNEVLYWLILASEKLLMAVVYNLIGSACTENKL